jgi:hypothetical protein
MSVRQPRFSMEEHARRGRETYERVVRPQVEAGHAGKLVAIDVDSGAFELGENSLSAATRLLQQFPDAQIWCVRIGSPTVHRFGARAVRG